MEVHRKNVTIMASGKIPVRALLDASMGYARVSAYLLRSNATETCLKNAMAPDRGNQAPLVRAIRRFALMERAFSVRPTICVATVRSFKRAMRTACGK